MKKALQFTLVLLCLSTILSAQTLYSPSGLIGKSTNSNVGIGTSSASDKLHVSYGGDVGIMLDDTYDTSNSPWRLWVDNWDGSASKNFTFKIGHNNSDPAAARLHRVVSK
ncbi:MAG: hypothetical protein PF517_19510 [Salinivirgaceae bacterium]|nr:hypothetical protein [Salinivirgaceae bacterium]